MRRTAACLAGWVVCAAIVAGARQTPPATPTQAPQTPVFRTGVDLIQLVVSALDKDRKPVRGLTQSDFSILEDGKPQTVAAFAAVDLPDSIVPATPWLRDVAPDVTTNDIDNRRVFGLVLDDAIAPKDLWATRAVVDIATKIVTRMGPGDLATVVFTGDNTKAQDLTPDRIRLLKAINTFSRAGNVTTPGRTSGPRSPAGCMPFLYSISVLERLSDLLSAIPDRRKAIVYLSAGMQLPPPGAANDPCDLNGHFRETLRQAQRANVSLYPIDVMGLQTLMSPGVDFLHSLADETGGHAATNSNDFEPAIAQMFLENSSYYLLGYQPANKAADGTFRRIEVKVDRPGVEVWTRKNYIASSPPKALKPGEAPPPPPSPALKAMAEIVPKTDLPLRLAAAAFAVPGKPTATVTLALGLRQPPQTARMTDEVHVLIKTFTPEGKALDTVEETMPINVPPVRRGAEFTRYELLTHIDMKPGRYEMRISTHSSAFDLQGSVYADVDVPDFAKAPLSLSGVILSATPGPTVAPAEALAGIVPLLPTTEREFARTDRVAAFLRVYQGGGRPAPVSLNVKIVDGQGKTAFENRETLGVDRFGTARAADERLALPLAQLTPGEYLLTVEAALDKASIRRDVRFTVR